MSTPPWEEIDHTADWALRVWGDDLPALFENAARGMVSLLGDAPPSASTIQQTIRLQAPDLETLLVDWLTELLTLIDEGITLDVIRVTRVEGLGLDAEVQGGPVTEPFRKEIKAVTYHMLAIQKTDAGYETVIVFDV